MKTAENKKGPQEPIGSVEFDKCEICGEEGPIQRTYFRYPIKCECHSPQHFELVRHCQNCIPEEPTETKITVKTEYLKFYAEQVARERAIGFAKFVKTVLLKLDDDPNQLRWNNNYDEWLNQNNP